MKFPTKYIGKWIATKNEKIVAADKDLSGLLKKVESKDLSDAVRIDLVPPKYFAG